MARCEAGTVAEERAVMTGLLCVLLDQCVRQSPHGRRGLPPIKSFVDLGDRRSMCPSSHMPSSLRRKGASIDPQKGAPAPPGSHFTLITSGPMAIPARRPRIEA
jgi:hypothetical protein